MIKLATSTLGILLLNPIGCSGLPHEDSGTGGTMAATGGYAGVVHCDPSTGVPCAVGQICKQTMFPIMPPQGMDSGLSDPSYLYECVPTGTGGSSSTGGSHSTGGAGNTGGTKNLGTMAALNTPEAGFSPNDDGWWKIAEAALRRT